MLSQFTRQATEERLVKYEVREKLQAMEKNPLLNTRATSYSANTGLYPNGEIPFVEKHWAYLMDHPKLDPNQYLANLRLMLKNRS